ncbi:uncharacterized protein LOC122153288 [Tyto alba]|uniref:uncharacterized protein LOC122153288 n=1 Tax=Tyto alba TaxID=56313 RepID=UPI001C685CD4|nr:uncharacterized protein LOC122153288 [Tyto alba]XP_042646501.1 uncharacterized protein LOC122153288 [Tyto alba]XP_042646502.1 uncharacterized protein LOC122153288 [Tyto alba]
MQGGGHLGQAQPQAAPLHPGSSLFCQHGSLLARRPPPQPRPRSARPCPRLRGHHRRLLPLQGWHPELGARGRARSPTLTPQLPTRLHGLPARRLVLPRGAPGSLSKGPWHSKKWHLVFPPGASLFAGVQEGAPGPAATARTALAGEPDPLLGLELLGSSASVAEPLHRGGCLQRQRLTARFAGFTQPCCNSSQQLLQPALQEEAAAEAPEPLGEGAQGVLEPFRGKLSTTVAGWHLPPSSTGTHWPPSLGGGGGGGGWGLLGVGMSSAVAPSVDQLLFSLPKTSPHKAGSTDPPLSQPAPPQHPWVPGSNG